MSQASDSSVFSLPKWVLASQVTQVTAGGMHSVALTQNGEVFSTGVNDEAALGRKTGEVLIPSSQNQDSEPCVCLAEALQASLVRDESVDKDIF